MSARPAPPPPPGWQGGFTLVELLMVVAVSGVLATLLLPALGLAKQRARRMVCLNNLRQFVVADLLYLDEEGTLPPPNPYIPSSTRLDRLALLAARLGTHLPPEPLARWPRRAEQPRWINCPFATASGFAEGLTVGGGLYTGYSYYGGIEDSPMVTGGLAVVVNPGQAADRQNTRRGVLWTDIVDEFATSDPRRFEFFHLRQRRRHPDFRFHAQDLAGMHRAWSDGAVEWTPARQLDLSGPASADLRLRHVLGNYYF